MASGIGTDVIEDSQIIHHFSELIADDLDEYIDVNKDLADYLNDNYEIFAEDEDGELVELRPSVTRFSEVMGLSHPYYQGFIFEKDYGIWGIVDRYETISDYVEDFLEEHGYYNRKVHDVIWGDKNPKLKDKITKELIDGFEKYYYDTIIIPTAEGYIDELEEHGIIVRRKGGRW